MDDIAQKLERVLGSLVDYQVKSDLISIHSGQTKLGSGGYGDVWLGEMTLENGGSTEDGRVATKGVAVKTLRQATGTKEELTLTACQLARELKVWAGLLHRNILELVGFYLSDTLENAWLLSPYEPEGNLAEFIEKKKPDEGRKMELLFDALCGLRYLHSHRPTIVHGDLKPENIIVGRDGFAKLCDFGLAKALDEPTGLTKAGPTQGTLRYMSPELFEDDAAATISSDIWAFACVTGEVLTGHAPYHLSKSSQAILMQIIKGKDPIPLNRFNLPTELGAWIRRCWDEEADERPSASDSINCLKQHMEATFPESSRLLQADDPSLSAIPSQTDDFFVELHRKKLREQSPDRPEYATMLTNLAYMLTERFDATWKFDDLEEAVTLHRQALQLRPVDHPQRQSCLRNLALALFKRFETTGGREDINEMVTICREAFQLCPASHEQRSSILIDLTAALISSHSLSPDVWTCEEAIGLCREVLQHLPLGNPNRVAGLQNLGVALRYRFNIYGELRDLEESIQLSRETLQLCSVGSPDHLTNLSNLGASLSLSAKRSLDDGTFNESIKLRREVLHLRPLGHPQHLSGLQALAWSLQHRFETFGDSKDLEEAIGLYQQALDLCPVGHPNRSASCIYLAVPLLIRSITYGDADDAATSVQLRREILQLHPGGDPDHHQSLHNLGWHLFMIFESLGEGEGLEEALAVLRESLKLYSPCDPLRKLILGSLGGALRCNFQKHGHPGDLAEAIELLRGAVEHLRVGDFRHAEIVQNLGTALMNGYQSTGEAKDIDEAIKFHRQALQLRPGRHAHRYDSLLALGKSLRVRGGADDIEEAKQLCAEALELVYGDLPGNLRRRTGIKVLLDEIEVTVVAAMDKSASVDNIAQGLRQVMLKDVETKS